MTSMELAAACTADVVLGDPRGWPHPVRLMGWTIEWTEGVVRRLSRSGRALQLSGVVLAVTFPALAYVLTWVLIEGATRLAPVLAMVLSVYLGYTTLAARDLRDHALAVWAALERQDLPSARAAVSRMVGRDTAQLDEPEVVRATIESVAENASDGIVAPLLYLAIGGAPLAMAYKAINTLDSMVGYRTERYRQLGWASARLDDVANFIPARLTGFLFVCAAPLVGFAARSTWRILRRDGHRHPSFNSGYPEAALAGALAVQLGGCNYYDGVPSERPLLGDPVRCLERQHIQSAVQLTWTASGLLLGGILVGKGL